MSQSSHVLVGTFFLGVVMAASLSACGTNQTVGCTSDDDCRGSRVCVQSVCMNPDDANNFNNANNDNNLNNANNLNNNDNNDNNDQCAVSCERPFVRCEGDDLVEISADVDEDCECQPTKEVLQTCGPQEVCDEEASECVPIPPVDRCEQACPILVDCFGEGQVPDCVDSCREVEPQVVECVLDAPSCEAILPCFDQEPPPASGLFIDGRVEIQSAPGDSGQGNVPVFNTGVDDYRVRNGRLSGRDAGLFEFTLPDGIINGGGGSADIFVAFNPPEDARDRLYRATLTVTTTDPLLPTARINLVGSIISSEEPCLDVSPGMLSLSPSLNVQDSFSLNLTNCGAFDAIVVNVLPSSSRLTFDDVPDFIASGSSDVINVNYLYDQVGVFPEVLVFEYISLEPNGPSDVYSTSASVTFDVDP